LAFSFGPVAEKAKKEKMYTEKNETARQRVKTRGLRKAEHK
jgi:hypothetical protein